MRVEREQATEKKQSGAAKQIFFYYSFFIHKKKVLSKTSLAQPNRVCGCAWIK
jgi:hypothetical protein